LRAFDFADKSQRRRRRRIPHRARINALNAELIRRDIADQITQIMVNPAPPPFRVLCQKR